MFELTVYWMLMVFVQMTISIPLFKDLISTSLFFKYLKHFFLFHSCKMFHHFKKISFMICCFLGNFYGMLTFVGLFDAKVIFLQAIVWFQVNIPL